MASHPKTNKHLADFECTSEPAGLLANLGVEAETIYEGDAAGCPHCAGSGTTAGRLDRAA